MADVQQGAGGNAGRPRDALRIAAIWVFVSLVGDLLFGFLYGPHIPPGRMTSSAGGIQFDMKVLFLVALPVVFGVLVYMGYAVFTWSASKMRSAAPADNRSHLGVQIAWIATTTFVVLGLFVFGTVELVIPAGSGGGEGPAPIWTPSSKTVLPIQVIAQQWKFTYRYPTFGGFETDQLLIPNDTAIAFHVTSLDVIHDFWAYQLGVKADANPGQDNVAFTTPDQLGRFTVRCDELCGIWHGSMYNYGHVVSKADFEHWATTTEASLAAATKLLPAFAWSYIPSANGAGGSYYPATNPFSQVETYGAATVSPAQAAAKSS